MEPVKNKPCVLLGLTGSVATIKAPLLIKSLSSVATVQVVASESSIAFLKEEDIPSEIRIWRDKDEVDFWNEHKDKVLHIELRRWADLFLIAPLSANTLAKMVHGFCDNVVTEVVRCWDVNEKPLLVAPGMNTVMWTNPPTEEHISVLEERGIQIIPPISKRLACGDAGIGGMAEVSDLTDIVCNVMKDRGLI